jgi:Transposase DDE domain
VKQKAASSHLCSQFSWSGELSEILSSENIHKEAKECGFTQRIRILLPDVFVQMCCFWNWKEAFPSLKRQSQWLLEKFGVLIAGQSLNERFLEPAVDLMQKTMGRISRIRAEEKLSEFCGDFFTAIFIFDSTVQQLFTKCESLFKGCGGGASSAGIKIQFGFDLLTGNLLHLISRNARDPDNGFRITDIVAGSLLMFDLGYFSTSFLALIQRGKAYFLCRYRFGTVVYRKSNGEFHRMDVMKIISRMKAGEILELSVYLGNADKTPARFILEKLPEELVKEKRRKFKRDKQKKGNAVSRERLDFCVVNAFVTNLPEEILSTEKVREIYSVRWQIEIVFKTWKSIFGLKNVTDINPYRLACMFYGGLIKILIATKVFWVFKLYSWHEHQKELSEMMAMRILSEKTESLLIALTSDRHDSEHYWEALKGTLFRYAIKQRRMKKLLPFEKLRLFS